MKTIIYQDDGNNAEYTIYIGENKKDNWNIIDNAELNDLWFHVENLPSCHIILKCDNKNQIKRY